MNIDLKTIYDCQIILMARLNRLEKKHDLIAEKLGIPYWDTYDDVVDQEEIKGALHTIAQSLAKNNI